MPGTRSTAGVLAVAAMLCTTATANAIDLNAGDILVADNQSASTGAIIKVDPATGLQEYVSHNGMSTQDLFGGPQGVIVDDDGSLLVADYGTNRIVRVDPATGEQTLVSDNSSPGSAAANLQSPAALVLDEAGQILVANVTSVVSVDPETGSRTLVSDNALSTGNFFTSVHAIALEASGDVLVTNIDSFDDVVRVDRSTGEQTVVTNTAAVAPGQALDLTVEADGNVLVADINGPPGQTGAVVRVNPSTGAPTVLSDNTINTGTDLFQDPAAITLDAQERILVADYGQNRITRVSPTTGQQTLVSDASTDPTPLLINPNGGITVVPEPLTCKGEDATVPGTDAPETLTGTSGADVIVALGGNDDVNAKGGEDLVCGGAGKDDLSGSGAKDKLYGEDGNDKLSGGGGAGDLCHGGPGNDTATGSCEKKKAL